MCSISDLDKRGRFQRFTPWLSEIAGIIDGSVFVAGDQMPPSIRTFVMGLAIF